VQPLSIARHCAATTGCLSWDAKGDVTQQRFTWFVWHGGQYREEPK
jgi:hypothetical protein